MDNGLSMSDLALLNNDGGNAFLWIFALLILCGGGFGGFGNRANDATTQEILYGQQFQNLNSAIGKIGDGIASLGYSQLQQMDANTSALTNSIATVNSNIANEGRNIQTQLCAINSNIDSKFAQIEKSQLEQRLAEQSQQISQLQLAQAMCGVPKYNATIPYTLGCGCNQ